MEFLVKTSSCNSEWFWRYVIFLYLFFMYFFERPGRSLGQEQHKTWVFNELLFRSWLKLTKCFIVTLATWWCRKNKNSDIWLGSKSLKPLSRTSVGDNISHCKVKFTKLDSTTDLIVSNLWWNFQVYTFSRTEVMHLRIF